MSKVTFVRSATASPALATLVQHKAAKFTSSGGFQLAFDAPCTVGNVIIVGVVFDSILNTAVVGDGVNTYTEQINNTAGGFDYTGLWTATATDDSQLLIDVTTSGSNSAQIFIAEYSNIIETVQDAATATNTPASNPLVIGPITATGKALLLTLGMTDAMSTFAGVTPAQTVVDELPDVALSSSLLSAIVSASTISPNVTASSLGGTQTSGVALLLTIPASDLELTFSENNGGDTLVAVFAATSSAPDFVTPPNTIVDSMGNVYTLVAYDNSVVAAPVSGAYTAQYIYMCQKCLQSTGDVLLTPPAIETPGNIELWAAAFELQCLFATLTVATDTSGGSATRFDEGNGTDAISLSALVPETYNGGVAQDTFFIGGIFDSGLNAFIGGSVTNPPDTATTVRTVQTVDAAPTDSSALVGVFEIPIPSSYVPNFKTVVIDGTLASATDAFGFMLGFVGSGATGGGAATTLTFSLNKGPEPIIPIEGRAIATVQIDCTQQAGKVVALPIDYPEYACYGDVTSDPTAFVVLEFDLEHLFQGSGLSELRTLMAWSRPAFRSTNSGQPPREDVPLTGGNLSNFPALLTNTTTLQTVVLGSGAVQFSADGHDYGDSIIVPFPANKHSLKFRFIAPQTTANVDSPIGKYTLQFCNWEVPPVVLPSAILSLIAD